MHTRPIDRVRRLQTLKAAVTLTDQQSQPRNDEAKRVLKFFMATLLNSNMPRPTDFDSMRSLTCLVPHYAEDVIYALDADEVEARTGKKLTPGKMTELVGIMEGMQITTLEFLRIQFADEWENFVKRLLVKYRDELDMSKVVPAKISVRDFQRGNDAGLFAGDDEARMDLMKWASERGQLLWRTTKGMMMYENALRFLDSVESADARSSRSSAFYESKFRCAAALVHSAATLLANSVATPQGGNVMLFNCESVDTRYHSALLVAPCM